RRCSSSSVRPAPATSAAAVPASSGHSVRMGSAWAARASGLVDGVAGWEGSGGGVAVVVGGGGGWVVGDGGVAGWLAVVGRWVGVLGVGWGVVVAGMWMTSEAVLLAGLGSVHWPVTQWTLNVPGLVTGLSTFSQSSQGVYTAGTPLRSPQI